MKQKFNYLIIYNLLVTLAYGFLFFNKKKSYENNFENSQHISEEPKKEIKYNNLYLMSKKYEDFLSENYGIQQENINHDVLTGNN